MNDKQDIEIDQALSVAISAAREAGAIQTSYLSKNFKIDRKGEIDLVTEIDLKCERAIIDIIKQTYPDHGALAEEKGAYSPGHEYKWIIDPIDGTTNYAHGFPVYCSSVALEAKGEVIVGAVYDPTRDEMFCAAKGGGATLNGKPISVSDVDDLIDSLLATGFPYTIKTEKINNLKQFGDMSMRAQAIRRPGAAALDLCYVACGRLDGFWEYHLKPWDMAGGVLIVSEAGGKTTACDGGRLDIYNQSLLASNGKIHEPMLEVLALD
ncbi:Inositol-1-monophosphatase [hydrothermal vent metagenome]|uniref:inositol-phosphate phosphatase n=1 Tax=hydrothermal vent metagenome TaxID=652676 RepID=A0A3B1C9Q2_9ZZZZ